MLRLQLLCAVDELCVPAFVSPDEMGELVDDIETMFDWYHSNCSVGLLFQFSYCHFWLTRHFLWFSLILRCKQQNVDEMLGTIVWFRSLEWTMIYASHVEGILIARVHPEDHRYCLQAFEWISIRTQHHSEFVWDSRIGWATVPGAPTLLTTAPMVLPYKWSEIPVTPMTGWNALLGSGSLLKLTLLSLHSASSQTLLEAPSDKHTFCWWTCTNRFACHEAIATILRTLKEPAKSGIAILCADSCTCHAFPWIASFLADYLEHCTLTMVKNGWCPRWKICWDTMPGFPCKSRHRHPQWYLHWSTKAAEEVGLWKIANCQNFADAHAGCNIYCLMNVDWLHQLLKGLFKDHTWEWIVSFLEDIYGQEKGLDLIDEWFSIIPRFSNTRKFGDKLTCVTQWTGAEYKDLMMVWLQVHQLCHRLHIDCLLPLLRWNHTQIPTDALSSISSNIHLFLPYRKSHSMSKIPKIHSLLHYIKCIREMGSANNSDTKISKAAHKNLIKDGYHSSNEINYILQMLQWETRLLLIKSRVSILLRIVKSDLILRNADIYR